MDKEIKRRWVEALRSGKYEQGQGKLLHSGKFCCLGVLCDIQGVPREEITKYAISPFDEESGLRAFAPIRGLLPFASIGKLSEMNDNGRNFDEIATYIEASL